MVRSSEDPHHTNGYRHPPESELVTHVVSATPLRTKHASDELADTLEELGADPRVVEAARAS